MGRRHHKGARITHKGVEPNIGNMMNFSNKTDELGLLLSSGGDPDNSSNEREAIRMKVKRCDHCGTLYMPDKYHPRQRFCTDMDCAKDRRRTYKREYNKEWREKNPNYFKEYWLRYREL